MNATESVRRAKQWLLTHTIELRAFVGYALIVFHPGAMPPPHPQAGQAGLERVPDDWKPEEYQLYIDEARRDMDGQVTDKNDVRARAQIVLTTALVLAGATVTSYASKHHMCAAGQLVYLISITSTMATALASGGIITAKSPIGAPNLQNLLHMATGKVLQRCADEYAASRHQGAATVAMLVTVLRDCVLALLIGAITLGMAHVWA